MGFNLFVEGFLGYEAYGPLVYTYTFNILKGAPGGRFKDQQMDWYVEDR